MTVFSICNIKGGSGKSTTAIHLAAYLHNKKIKTAVVDCDGQQTISAWINLVSNLEDVTIFKSTNPDDIEDAILELEQTHDAVIVDVAGSSEELMKIVLSLSNRTLIPLAPSPLDITSTVSTIKQVIRARRRTAKEISATVLLNKVVKNTTLAQETREMFVNYDGIEFSSVEVPQTQRLMKLASNRQTVFDSSENKDIAKLYTQIFKEFTGGRS